MVKTEGVLRTDPEAAQLVAVLRQMGALLLRHDKMRWARKLELCRVIIESSDFHGVARLLALYRGRRSLNQVVLGVQLDNERFAALRAQAWARAERMRRKTGSGE